MRDTGYENSGVVGHGRSASPTKIQSAPGRPDGGGREEACGLRLVTFKLPSQQAYTLDTTAAGADLYRDGIARHGGQDAEWRLCMRLLRPGDTFVDLGANIGVFSIPAAVLGAEVHAFELLADNARRLAEAVERDGIERLRVVLGAVWDRPGTVDFDGFSAWGHVRPGGRLSIATVTVDDYVAQRKLGRVSVLKVDVEGAEMAALDGARATISRDHPDILIESNSVTCGTSGYSYRDLLGRLRGHGYAIYRIEDGVLHDWPDASVQEVILADYLATVRPADALEAVAGVPVRPMPDERVLTNVLGQDHWGPHHWMHVLAVCDRLPGAVRADARVVALVERWHGLREEAAMQQVLAGRR